MSDALNFARGAVALVWFYQGLWQKLLGRSPHHEAIVASVPFFSPAQAHAALMGIGAAECVIAVWVLSGVRPKTAAVTQIAVVAVINTGGLAWAGGLIGDPAGMLVQNFAFLTLAWLAAGRVAQHAAIA